MLYLPLNSINTLCLFLKEDNKPNECFSNIKDIFIFKTTFNHTYLGAYLIIRKVNKYHSRAYVYLLNISTYTILQKVCIDDNLNECKFLDYECSLFFSKWNYLEVSINSFYKQRYSLTPTSNNSFKLVYCCGVHY